MDGRKGIRMMDGWMDGFSARRYLTLLRTIIGGSRLEPLSQFYQLMSTFSRNTFKLSVLRSRVEQLIKSCLMLPSLPAGSPVRGQGGRGCSLAL